MVWLRLEIEMKANVLFSTTRQWNPGDEFILLGVLNIFKELEYDFNPVIYNRSPEIRQKLSFINKLRYNKFWYNSSILKLALNSFARLGFLDNSFKNDTDGDIIDLIVLAGSPEWVSYPSIELFQLAQRKNIKMIGLGLGTKTIIDIDKKNKVFKEVFQNQLAALTVRDKLTEEILSDFEPQLLPCPALFSANRTKQVTEVKNIAIAYGINDTVVNHKVSKKSEKLLEDIIGLLKNDYTVKIVCHYIDEIEVARKRFPELEVLYSYDSKDYEELYSEFDFVIGTRVHGIGMCASMGIPGIGIAHDNRGDTVKGFLAEVVSEDSDLEGFSKVFSSMKGNISKLNENLMVHKDETLLKYRNKLENNL